MSKKTAEEWLSLLPSLKKKVEVETDGVDRAADARCKAEAEYAFAVRSVYDARLEERASVGDGSDTVNQVHSLASRVDDLEAWRSHGVGQPPKGLQMCVCQFCDYHVKKDNSIGLCPDCFEAGCLVRTSRG